MMQTRPLRPGRLRLGNGGSGEQGKRGAARRFMKGGCLSTPPAGAAVTKKAGQAALARLMGSAEAQPAAFMISSATLRGTGS